MKHLFITLILGIFQSYCCAQLSINNYIDPSTHLGVIQVGLQSNFSDGPFTYIINEGDLATSLESHYSLISNIAENNGIPFEGFVQGKITSTSHDFKGLQPGMYNVGVYDRNGELILFEKKVKVYSNVNLIENNNIAFTNGEMSTLSKDASTKIDFLMKCNRHFNGAKIGFEHSGDVDYFVGLIDVKKGFNNYTDLDVSLRLNDGGVEVYFYGELQYVYSEGVTIGDRIDLKYTNFKFFLLINDDVIWFKDYFNSKDLILGIGSRLPNISVPITIFDLALPFHVSYENSNSNCEENKSDLDMEILGLSAGEQVIVTVRDENNQVVSVNNLNLVDLNSGIYTVNIIGSLSGNSYNYSYNVYSGVVCNMILANNIDTGNLGNSAIGQAQGTGMQEGKGIGNNVLDPGESGWVRFKLEDFNPSYFIELGITDNPDLNLTGYPSYEDRLFMYKTGSSQSVYCVEDVHQVVLSESREIVVTRDDSGVLSIVNGGFTVYTGVASMDRWVVWIRQLSENEGVQNIITSFGCAKTDKVYASADYEMNSYYHVVKDCVLRVRYEEEYTPGILKFKIYNDNNVVVKSNLDLSAVNTVKGENYLDIDLTSMNSCQYRGFYYLEIINEKKEKKYLRFFIDASGNCISYEPIDLYTK